MSLWNIHWSKDFLRILELEGTLRSSNLAFSITGEQAEGQEDSLEQQRQDGREGHSVHPLLPISGTVHVPLPHGQWWKAWSLAVREQMVDFHGTHSTFHSLNNGRSLIVEASINEFSWEFSWEKTDEKNIAEMSRVAFQKVGVSLPVAPSCLPGPQPAH